MDKFLLAENPFATERSGAFIIHLIDPIAIIRCTEGHVASDNIFKHYQFTNSDDFIEEWTLSIFHFFTTDFLEEPTDRAPKLMDRAWRWYRSYMEWEDKNIDEGTV